MWCFPLPRTMLTRAVALVLIFAGPAVSGCRKPEPLRTGPVRIVVTIPPLAGIAKALAPADAEVTVLIKPGRSEHGYEFNPEDIAALARADVVVYVGLGLEPRVSTYLAKDPSSARRDVRLGQVLGLEQRGEHDAQANHDHEPSAHEGHDHGPVDPHVWLDPLMMEEAAGAIAGAVEQTLVSRGIQAETALRDSSARLAALGQELQSLHSEYKQRLAPLAGTAIVTHHSAWGYLAKRYDLQIADIIRPIETNEPTPAQLAAVVDAIRSKNVRAVFVEPQFNPGAAERIAQAAGVRLGVLNPLGDGDYFAMMRANLDELVGKLSP